MRSDLENKSNNYLKGVNPKRFQKIVLKNLLLNQHRNNFSPFSTFTFLVKNAFN